MYVKWFDTVMFYYVILVYFVNVTFSHSKFPAVPSPYVLTLKGMEPRRQVPASGDITGDTAGGTSWERRTRKVKKRSRE
ncbi:unnamed protein product [Staurois parvus]|uniref:Secreted protein n=1 Tax=Staurois parvus TaxID=386267 RepID=A0ABN9CKE3_9NEOB|nr:unnamed protein product [Staurois parvus]